MVSIFCVLATLSYTDRQVLSLLVDPIRRDLSISDTEVSLLQGAAFAVVYAFATLGFGRMADVLPRRMAIIGGLVLWSLATAGCGLADGFQALFAARMLVGVGEAALAPAVISMIADLFAPGRRGLAISVFLMGMTAGSGAAIAIGGGVFAVAESGGLAWAPLVGHLAPWRVTLLLLGAAGAVGVALMLAVAEPTRRMDARAGFAPLGQALATMAPLKGALIPLYAALALIVVGDFSLLNWAPTLLGRNYGLDPATTGALLGSASIAAGVLGTLAAGFAGDIAVKRGGAALQLRLGAAVGLLGVLGGAVAFAGAAWQVVALTALWLFISGATSTLGITALQNLIDPQVRGLSAALVSFFNMLIGLVVGASATAILTDHVYRDPHAVGLSISTLVIPAGLLVCLCLWLAARGAAKAEPRQP